MRGGYVIEVLRQGDPERKRQPGAKQLMADGVPARVALRWQRVRREMTPKGLARKAHERRN